MNASLAQLTSCRFSDSAPLSAKANQQILAALTFVDTNLRHGDGTLRDMALPAIPGEHASNIDPALDEAALQLMLISRRNESPLSGGHSYLLARLLRLPELNGQVDADTFEQIDALLCP